MYAIKTKNSPKRFFKYLFFVSLCCWTLLGLLIGYQYIIASSQQISAKGGTFVEGIFDTTSFLPYLNNDRQSKFYQGMLFQGCLKAYGEGENITYQDDICHVTTTDYKNYYISLFSGNIWSDGVPVNMEDVIFTYEKIIKDNKWDIDWLGGNSNIEIENTDNNKLKITFPNASIDNNLFFTNYILPKHALGNLDLETYQQTFSINPIHTKCAKILPQTNDPYSLIFNLASCESTNLGFYQIKNNRSFKLFKDDAENKKTIVDIYVHDQQAGDFVNKKLITNNLVTILFNNKSEKLNVRLRRSLGGLINHNFFEKENTNFLSRYDDKLFVNYLSTGGNISDFLVRLKASPNDLLKENLLESNIKALPEEIDIKENERNHVFFIEEADNKMRITLKFEEKFDKVAIQYQSGDLYYPQSYSSRKKEADYTISTEYGNLQQELNNYSIFGFTKDKKTQIGNIDIYNLQDAESSESTDQILEKLQIVYHNNPMHMKVVKTLQDVFGDMDILEYFSFEGFDDINEMEGQIIAGNYDLLISSINMGLKKDITGFLSTDNPQVNPTQYYNQKLLNDFQQYFSSTSERTQEKLAELINETFGKDMPFVILGRELKDIYMRESFVEKLPTKLHEHNRRNKVYSDISLVENVKIESDELRDFSVFWGFIKETLKKNDKG